MSGNFEPAHMWQPCSYNFTIYLRYKEGYKRALNNFVGSVSDAVSEEVPSEETSTQIAETVPHQETASVDNGAC